MQSRRLTTASKKRRGFTLIELLVVISIIATLMSLILPAIQSAREAGRRTQCLNNIRNVTLAAVTSASSNRSRLPALAYFPLNAAGTAHINGRSMFVDLLPFLDQQSTFDRWDKARSFNSTGGAFSNLSLSQDLYVEAYACPNDESAFATKGGLSYVANGGWGAAGNHNNSGNNMRHSFVSEGLDWNANSSINNWPAYDSADAALGQVGEDLDDQAITQGTGVFWSEFEGVAATRNGSATLGKIYDGTSNTLMFGENINAENGATWASPATENIAFVLPMVTGTVNAATLQNPVGTGSVQVTVADNPWINQAKTGPEGQRPYLNSNHPGIVVVSTCDGGARTLSEDIDQNIYCQLMTASATRLRAGISPEDPLSGDF